MYICPICKKENNCAIEKGLPPYHCWCMNIKIPEDIQKEIEHYDDGCICKFCLEKLIDKKIKKQYNIITTGMKWIRLGK